MLHLDALLQKIGVERTEEVKQQLGDLTYGECDDFVSELASAANPQAALSVLSGCWSRCTMQGSISQEDEKTRWTERCKEEAQQNR
jgi:hypothetical protein